MAARDTRNKYLKVLFSQWRGLIALYNKGLAKSDAVLASAVWRNVFKASEEVDVRQIALIVAYMRSAAQTLDSVLDNALQQTKFSVPPLSQQKTIAGLRIKEMDMPFANATVANTTVKGSPALKTR